MTEKQTKIEKEYQDATKILDEKALTRSAKEKEEDEEYEPCFNEYGE